MSYLVDTCALSEMIRPAPAPQVVEWFETVPREALFLGQQPRHANGADRLGSRRSPQSGELIS